MKRLAKYILILFPIILLLIFKTNVVSAEDLGGQKLINDVNRFQNQASKTAEVKQRKLSDVIKRADELINNRINSLNRLIARIQNDKRLTDSQKASLISDIQTNISGLNTLKAKIDADKDLQTALTDGKQIFTNFRIYAIFEPKIRLLITLNNMKDTVTRLQGLVPQIQTLIDNLKSQGKDVSGLTPLLSDISSQLSTMQTTIDTDITTVQGVTINSANPEVTFSKVKADINAIIKTGFNKIREDIEQMRLIFRQIIIGSATNPISTSSSSAESTTK